MNHTFNKNDQSAWTTRRTVTAVLVVLSVIFGFLLIIQFREVVILVFTGVVISILLAPAVEWLHLLKIPRSLSILSIYLLVLLLLLAIILIIVPQIVQQISAFIPVVEKYYETFHTTLVNSPHISLRQLAGNLPTTIGSIPNNGSIGTPAPVSVNWTLNMAQTILSGLFTFSIVLLIGFYWTIEGERVLYILMLLLPIEKRESAKEAIHEIEGRVGGFMRGQGLLALTIGGAALVAYFLIGLPSVLSLAFLAGLFELVPVFGPTLGAIPAVLVAITVAPSKIIWVIAATLIIQMIENHLLAPRVMQKTVGVNPMVTILAIVGFGSLFGFAGLLLAIPLAAVFQVLIDRSLLRPQGPVVEAPLGRNRISKLSYETQEFVRDVRKWVREKSVGKINAESDEVEDTIEAIATDLDNILAQTFQVDITK